MFFFHTYTCLTLSLLLTINTCERIMAIRRVVLIFLTQSNYKAVYVTDLNDRVGILPCSVLSHNLPLILTLFDALSI